MTIFDSSWRCVQSFEQNGDNKNVLDKKYNYAGMIILNNTFDKILLVKGKSGQKWGPPKGHRIDHESYWHTAVRETHEETGIIIPEKIQGAENLFLFIENDAKLATFLIGYFKKLINNEV